MDAIDEHLENCDSGKNLKAMWDHDQDRHRKKFYHDGCVNEIAVEKTTIASCGADNMVFIWSMEEGVEDDDASGVSEGRTESGELSWV